MTTILIVLAAAAQAYLLGSIDTGILVSKYLYHDDVRNYGSGAAGMTNMLRTFGKKAAALTAAGDVLKGVAAVIDKDFAAELLAEQVDADALLILTEVEKVAIRFGKPDQEDLGHLNLAEAARYAEEGQFGVGSMLPKVEAAMKFVRNNPGRKAIITSLDKCLDALDGKTGTVITFA